MNIRHLKIKKMWYGQTKYQWLLKVVGEIGPTSGAAQIKFMPKNVVV